VMRISSPRNVSLMSDSIVYASGRQSSAPLQVRQVYA
jgi:hypothetical protein